jgi:hypothetical protein
VTKKVDEAGRDKRTIELIQFLYLSLPSEFNIRVSPRQVFHLNVNVGQSFGEA